MTQSHFKDNKHKLVLCDSCFIDLSTSTRIKCAECSADICPLCFFKQKPIHLHSNTHKYKAVEPLTFTIYDEAWTAMEEILFVEGLFYNGIGNWADIAFYMKTKTIDEIETHFYKIFNLEKKNSLETENNIASLSNPNFHEVVTYMPFRKDFDTEYENEHENILKELEFKEEDSVIEKRVKNALLDSYSNVIELRNLKKFIILNKNIINNKDLTEKETKMCETEKNILKRIKCLVPFLSKNDFNMFYKGLCIEETLLAKIQNYEPQNSVQKGVHKLEKSRTMSENEINFCKKIKLSTRSYLKMKSTVINDFLKHEFMNHKRLKVLFSENDERTELIYKFFIEQGWVL